MTEEEIKEWDDALLDLINNGLIRTICLENGEIGFTATVQMGNYMVL